MSNRFDEIADQFAPRVRGDWMRYFKANPKARYPEVGDWFVIGGSTLTGSCLAKVVRADTEVRVECALRNHVGEWSEGLIGHAIIYARVASLGVCGLDQEMRDFFNSPVKHSLAAVRATRLEAENVDRLKKMPCYGVKCHCFIKGRNRHVTDPRDVSITDVSRHSVAFKKNSRLPRSNPRSANNESDSEDSEDSEETDASDYEPSDESGEDSGWESGGEFADAPEEEAAVFDGNDGDDEAAGQKHVQVYEGKVLVREKWFDRNKKLHRNTKRESPAKIYYNKVGKKVTEKYYHHGLLLKVIRL